MWFVLLDKQSRHYLLPILTRLSLFPPFDCAHFDIVKLHWNERLQAIVPALCLWCYQDSTSEYYLWCVSSSQCATAVRPFLSPFNSNLAHYSQTTKALSVHSGAHGSEWWIFPITLLSIQVSGKHRPMETALEKPHSYVCLTPGVLGNVSTISAKTSKLKGKVKYSKSATWVVAYMRCITSTAFALRPKSALYCSSCKQRIWGCIDRPCIHLMSGICEVCGAITQWGIQNIYKGLMWMVHLKIGA